MKWIEGEARLRMLLGRARPEGPGQSMPMSVIASGSPPYARRSAANVAKVWASRPGVANSKRRASVLWNNVT